MFFLFFSFALSSLAEETIYFALSARARARKKKRDERAADATVFLWIVRSSRKKKKRKKPKQLLLLFVRTRFFFFLFFRGEKRNSFFLFFSLRSLRLFVSLSRLRDKMACEHAVGIAVRTCPFLKAVAAKEGDDFAANFSVAPLRPAAASSSTPSSSSSSRRLLDEPAAFESFAASFEFFHGERGVVPLRARQTDGAQDSGRCPYAAAAAASAATTATAAAATTTDAASPILSSSSPMLSSPAAPFASISLPLFGGGMVSLGHREALGVYSRQFHARERCGLARQGQKKKKKAFEGNQTIECSPLEDDDVAAYPPFFLLFFFYLQT